MDIDKFKKEIPNLQGYTIGNIRINNIKGLEVVGFVLIDKTGKKRYIMHFGDDFRVEDYW